VDRSVARMLTALMAVAIGLPILYHVAGLATTVLADCAIGSDCFEIEPPSGRPGTQIHITATTTADCHDLADYPRPWLQFYRGGLGPRGYGRAAEMFPIAEGTWEVTVPEGLTNGTWKLATYCIGDGPVRTLGTDAVFTVVGAPDTNTAPAIQPTGDPNAWRIALASGALAFVWTMVIGRRRTVKGTDGS
jgi:hypothetical protein